MQVREVMTKSPVCCPPDMPLRDVARLMLDFDCGEVSVVDRERRPIGVLTDRGIACRAVAGDQDVVDLSAEDCMTSRVVTVTPDTAIEDCCRTMESHKIRRVPVVDEGGSCCGIVSQADVALRLADGHPAHLIRVLSRPAAVPAQPAAVMEVDPVCGARVDPQTAAATTTFERATYFFCSTACRQTFLDSPDDYVAPA